MKTAIFLSLFVSSLFSYSIISNNLLYLKKFKDIKRNYNNLKELNVSLIYFKEKKYNWYMFLVINPKKPKGPFWFIPHDNENSAFDSAVYAIKKYGGGFLAIYNRNRRFNLDQDPNRNFSLKKRKEKSCKFQKDSSYIYTSTIINIINRYKAPTFPYLTLHNNTNRGGISILKESLNTKSFLAYPKKQILKGKGLADEDNLIYIASSSKNLPLNKINTLLKEGLNVKYEYVTPTNNDCSMSNFIILNIGNNYYNIEAEHGKTNIQKIMIDKLLKIIKH